MNTQSLAIEHTAAQWLARRDGSDWSPAAQAELERWLDQSSLHKVTFLRLQAAWQQAGRLRALGAGRNDGKAAPERWRPAAGDRRHDLLQALPPARRSRRRRRGRWAGWAVAMASLLVVGAVLVGRFWRPPPAVDVITYDSAIGQIRTLALADGSQVTLGSDSRIQVRLAPDHRDVALMRGEAIFAVAKDRRRPFRVASDGYRAVAVGTRYSVRRGDAGLRVVVTEGTVRLESPARGNLAEPSILLPAGSVALVRGKDVLVRSLAVADAQQLLRWRDGLLVFRDATLADAASEFNRYNARKLVIADAAAGALRIGGSFRWDNEEAFVRLLQAGFPVRAQVQPDCIIVHSR